MPSDKWQVDAMAHLIQEFGWNWVAVVGSEEEYGQRGVQQFSKLAENMSVCVAYQGLIPVYTEPGPAVKTIINNIKATEVKVVVVFALSGAAEFFFKEVSVAENQSTSHSVTCITVGNHLVHFIPGYKEQFNRRMDCQHKLVHQQTSDFSPQHPRNWHNHRIHRQDRYPGSAHTLHT